MTDVSRGFLAAAGVAKLIVGPEGAVDQDHVGGSGDFHPFGTVAGKISSHEQLFAILLEEKSQAGVVGRHSAASFVADEVRVSTAQRNGVADEGGCFAGIFGEMNAETSFGGERLPLHGRIGAIENFEDAIFGFECPLNARGSENKEILKFAQMQQAHRGIDVRGGQKNSTDGRAAWRRRIRRQLRGREDLRAQVRRSADKKPDVIGGRKGDLGLGPRFGADRAISQARTVAAGAIPLGETTARSRAENPYSHERTARGKRY